VVQVPIDAVRETKELAPVSRMFAIPIDTIINSIRRDLVATEGAQATPAKYAVVALPDGTYEMRMIKTGPTDLRVAQVIDGLKEGDKVVELGAIITARPAVPPKLQIAENLRRGAAVTNAPRPGATTQAGQPENKGKAGKP
jgi:hypothetical protein